jgi:hypothetical protein
VSNGSGVGQLDSSAHLSLSFRGTSNSRGVLRNASRDQRRAAAIGSIPEARVRIGSYPIVFLPETSNTTGVSVQSVTIV